MLSFFEGGDAKCSLIRNRSDADLDKFSQVLRGSASDNLIAETVCFVLNALFYGEPVYLHKKRFGMFCSPRFKDEFGL